MTDWDWERYAGETLEPFDGALTRTIQTADGTVSTQIVDLTGDTLLLRFTCISTASSTTPPAPLEQAATVTGDPTTGLWHYDQTTEWAALPGGIYHLRVIRVDADDKRESFPLDADKPYLLGRIITPG